jgi:hypothetical protein
MRTLNKPMRTTAFTAFLLLASAALAQSAPDWRAVLVDLYSIDTAFDACKAVTPSASDLLRLEAAIAHVEEKSASVRTNSMRFTTLSKTKPVN